jgi:tetratricopeptide repeat protein
VVISPRKTMLRNLRPMIRWSPIAGAKQSATYRVTLYGEGGKAIWSKEISGETRLNYPDAEPPLMPGQTYKVVVASEGMTSEEDHTPGLGFTTLTIEEARALADKESNTTELALPENQTRFLVANLYAAKEQFAEAIELLQKLSSEMKEPAVAVMLGDLYAVIGLSREAEKEYLLALTLMDANDFDGHGMTQRSLAQVYETLGNIDEALARLRQAITAYRRLKLRTIINSLLTKERRLKRQQTQELNRSRHNRSAQ